MATYTELLPPRKTNKHSVCQFTPVGGAFTPAAGALRIDTDRTSTTYTVVEFPTDWGGRAFRLAKVTTGTDPAAEAYSVFCSARGPEGDSCDCKGMTFAGTCKHADAVRACVGNGWL